MRLLRAPDATVRARRERYSLLLGAITLAFALQGIATPHAIEQAIVSILLSITLLLALSTGEAKPKVMQAAMLLAACVVLASVVEAANGNIDGRATRIANGLLVGLAPPAIIIGVIRGLRARQAVTLEAVFGVLCVYLLLGMFFAFVYGSIDHVGGGSFFAGGQQATVSRCLYFSFSTLTTAGFGDFTAQSNLGHTLCVFEALVGQIYLVTVVALIVANLGRARRGLGLTSAGDRRIAGLRSAKRSEGHEITASLRRTSDRRTVLRARVSVTRCSGAIVAAPRKRRSEGVRGTTTSSAQCTVIVSRAFGGRCGSCGMLRMSRPVVRGIAGRRSKERGFVKLVTAIVRPEKVNDVLEALYRAEIRGVSMSRVQGHGGELERVETYRGTTVKMELSEKVRFEVAVSDDFVQNTVDAFCSGARTGQVGDGKIFVIPLEQAIRIRTGETDEGAVTPVNK